MRKKSLVLISNGVEEGVFFSSLAAKLGLGFYQAHGLPEYRAAMGEYPDSVIIWDIDPIFDDEAQLMSWSVNLKEWVDSARVFALTNDVTSAYTLAFKH